VPVFRRSRSGLAARWRASSPAAPAEPALGVTSFHLWWQDLDAGTPIVEASAVLTVVQPPAVDRLYFWALQATFLDGGRSYGGAHTGLQWNPRHPRNRAVNWGGYADPPVSNVLRGSTSMLPSTPDDPNTRDYPWEPGRPYRFTIRRGDDGWSADVGPVGEAPVAIRSLFAGGDRLAGLVVWSEVFAACSDPPVVVRWSELSATTASGEVVRPESVRVSFQGEGTCPNTDVRLTPDGIEQASGVARTVRDGAVLPVPDRGAPR